MREIFLWVSITHRDREANASYASLALPASYYYWQDAMEQVQAENPEDLRFEIRDYEDFSYLRPYLESLESMEELKLLNALTTEFSWMDQEQKDIFEGLLRIAEGKHQTIGLAELYDMAVNVDKGEILYPSEDDDELGFLCKDWELLPESVFQTEQLDGEPDYERIGREYREAHGGVFLTSASGYVQLTDKDAVFEEAHKTVDLELQPPNYTVLLHTYTLCDNLFHTLALPAGNEEIAAALKELGVRDTRQIAWDCADCMIPDLRDAFTYSGGLYFANRVAGQLSALSPEEVTKLKCLAETQYIYDCAEAEELIQHLDEYDLWLCGESPEGHPGAVGSSYGVIARKDGQPSDLPTHKDRTQEEEPADETVQGLNPLELLEYLRPEYGRKELEVRAAIPGLIVYATELSLQGAEAQLPMLREQLGFMAAYWFSETEEEPEKNVLENLDHAISSARESGLEPLTETEKSLVLRGLRTHVAEVLADMGRQPICLDAERLLNGLEHAWISFGAAQRQEQGSEAQAGPVMTLG